MTHLLAKTKPRLFLSLAVFFTYINCFGQYDTEIAGVKNLPIANNWATIKGSGYGKILYISKDALKRDLKIELWDSTYKIKFFKFSYLCEDCDIWIRTIVGDTIKIDEYKILNNLKKGEMLEFQTFKILKADKSYTIPSFAVMITE